MERGRYCSYIERKQFVFSVDNGRLKGGRRVSFGVGVVAPTHISPGDFRVETSREFFQDETLVRSVFEETIDYWSADEAGVYCFDAGQWCFWWRWKRDGLAESPVPDIPWGDSPAQHERLDEGLLSIWPQYAPRDICLMRIPNATSQRQVSDSLAVVECQSLERMAAALDH